MAGSIKGIIVEIGGDTSGLQKALSKVNSATSSLSKELTGINRLLKLDPKNTELLSQKQAVLSENIETTKNKLNQLKDIYAQAIEAEKNGAKISEENWRALQKDIENTKIKLNKLLLEQDAWNVNGKKVEEFGDKIVKVSSKIDNLGSKLTKTLTTSVLALGVASSKSAIDFESAFAGVEKTVDGTAEQMASLKQGIRDMSKEIPSSATEISAVAEAAGQLGIQTDNILGFSKVMIDMGNSTNLSADEAATALAKFANITNMSANDYSRLGAVIVDLGNNFATTEKDIVEMGTRLAATGELTGLSQAQIMSLATAMSSVGLEAEAGGSAMSKLLKNIQLATETGSDDLKTFASVANMSVSDFKKSFEEDAVKALTAFIGGLNDTERNGKSAIAILDDMGITEVRMSNTILSLANSSGLLNNAINIGNKAWQENTALTNEANKRYETTESKLKTTINKLKDFGTTIGNKLLPSVNRILDGSDKWIKKLEKLDDATLDNIIRIGLFVAAAGPVLKILGKLGSGIGTVIKTTGQFSQAMAVVKTGAKSTSASVNSLASGIKGLTSPFGIATLAIAAVTAEIAIMDKKLGENLRNTKEYTQTIKDNINSRKELADSQIEQMNGNISEINYIRNLNQELKNIVDENGKVKDGYQERVNFILNELNNALGTEYTLNGNIIDAYQTMQKEIDNLINKKRAQIVIETQEEQYREAIQNKTKDYQELISTQDKLAEAQKRRNDAENEFLNAQKYGGNAISTMKYKKAIDEVNELTDTYNKQKEVVEKNNTAINKYEKNVELMAKGTKESYDQIYQSINEVQTSVTATEQTEMAKRIENLQYNLEESRRMYNLEAEYNKNAKDNIYATNVEESEKNLQLAIDELTKATSTVGEMSPDVIQAWKNLATNSREEYKTALSKMSQDMQDRINNITGVVNSDTSVKDAAKFLGQEAVNQLNISSKFEEAGKNWIKGVSKGINNKLLRQEALSSMHSFGVEGLNAIRQQAWDEHSPSKETEKAAKNLLKGVTKGINKEKSSTISNMLKFGQEFMNKFNGSMSLNFNSLQNIPKLQNSISQTISTQLQPKILQPNIVINTQHLDNNEMNRIIDTVNRRFGMQI